MTDAFREQQRALLEEKMTTFASGSNFTAVIEAKVYLLRHLEGGDLSRITAEDLVPWLSDESDAVRDFALRLVQAMPMTESVREGWDALCEAEFWRFGEWCETMTHRLEDSVNYWPFTAEHVRYSLATVFVATQFQVCTKAWIRRVPTRLFAAAMCTTDGDLRSKLLVLTHEAGADLPPCPE